MYFVYVEIRQNGAIARAELSAYSIQKFDEIGSRMLDPEFSALYHKGVQYPADLNESERHVLNAHFDSLFTLMYYEYQN